MRSFGHHAMPGAHAAVRHGCPKRAAETSSCHAWPLRPGREHAARLGSTRSPQSASSSPQVETKLITGTVGTAEQQRSYRYPAHCPLPLLPPPLLSPSLTYPVFCCLKGTSSPAVDDSPPFVLHEAAVASGRIEIRPLTPGDLMGASVILTRAFANTENNLSLSGAT